MISAFSILAKQECTERFDLINDQLRLRHYQRSEYKRKRGSQVLWGEGGNSVRLYGGECSSQGHTSGQDSQF